MTAVDPGAHLAALGLGPGATVEQVEKAHKAKVRPLQKRASNAPEHLRDQAERDLAALEAATHALLAHLRAAGADAPGQPAADGAGGHRTDSHEVLGLTASATPEQIEAAYVARARVAQHQSSVGTTPEVRQAAKRDLARLASARQALLGPTPGVAHDPEPHPGGAAPDRDVAAGSPRPAASAGSTADEVPDDERLRQAEQRFAQGEFAHVVTMLEPLVRRPEPHRGAARTLGLAAARQGRVEVALEALQLARPEHRGDPEVAAVLVGLLCALQRQGEAVAVAERAVRDDPTERLAASRAALEALCAAGQPEPAVRLAGQLLGPRRDEPPVAECLVDVFLAACDAHRTVMADGRRVLTSVTQCLRLHDLATRLVALQPTAPDAVRRLRQVRVQLMDARRSTHWTRGERWQPRTIAPAVLVTRWGTP